MMYPNVPSKPQPKRILFVHSSDELYGSDQVLLNLVTGLDRRQFEPIVALPTDLAYKGELSEMLKARDIRCYKIKMGVLRRRYFKPYGFMQYLFYTVWGVWQLSKIIRQHQIELIH